MTEPFSPPAPSGLLARISAYLMGGGLWNPELANHDAVRDLLIDCRDALAKNFAPVSETTTNQRAACREDGSADSSKPNGSQDSPAAAHPTLLSAIGEPRVEAEATHPENKVSAALMIACSRVPAEYGLLVNREFWSLLRGSNMKRDEKP